MTTKHFALAGIAMLFFSCSDDDQALTLRLSDSNETVFDYYTIDRTTTSNSSANTSGAFTTANLQNEKFFSETSEAFVNGVGQGQQTTQRYFYENGLLVKREYFNDIRYFFYDDQGNLIGLNWVNNDSSPSYYRFVHVTASQVYFERSNLPYNDPAAVGSNRIIIEFDQDDNIISAGRDLDLDGVADDPHTFNYDSDGNLTTINQNDGSVIDIPYSSIKNNFAKLALNTYGKKNLLIYQAECYAFLLLNDIRHSPNLRVADTEENVIEVLQPPYYYKQTTVQPLDDGEITTITTFYTE